MYGTDFEAIARVMTLRTRTEIKRKFNAEDKRNPTLVTDCLLYKRVPIGSFRVFFKSLIGITVPYNGFVDIEELGRITGKDLSGPPPEIRRPLARLVENEAGAEDRGGQENPDDRPMANGNGRRDVGLFLDSPKDYDFDDMDVEDEPGPGRAGRSPALLSADALIDSSKS